MNTQGSRNIITVSIKTFSERFYFWCLHNIGFEWIFLLHTVSRSFWTDHVLGWWKHEDDPNVLFLKYENLQKVCCSDICILSCCGLLGYIGNAFAHTFWQPPSPGGGTSIKINGCSSHFVAVNAFLLSLRIFNLKSSIAWAFAIPFKVLRRYKIQDIREEIMCCFRIDIS